MGSRAIHGITEDTQAASFSYTTEFSYIIMYTLAGAEDLSFLEENLFFYFRAARPNDIRAQWYPAAYLLSVLSLNGRTQSNAQTKHMLTTILEKNHFHSRKTDNKVTEYWVVEYSSEERAENSIRPQLPVQQGLEL